MQRADDVTNPFIWLGADGDGFWNDLLSMVFAGSTWPEGSESAVGELAQEWADLAQALADVSGDLQAAAADLLAAWDAPAAEGFDDLARTLLGSPDSGLPGHVQNASAVACQVGGFGVELQYAKVSVNIAVVVAAVAAVIAVVMAFAGGLSLASLGPVASTARSAVMRALDQLASAAGRRALVQEVGRAVAGGAGRLAAAHTAGHHLRHEIVEEVLEELAIDVGTQGWQVADGSRTDWNGLSTVMAGMGGGFGGAAGAGLVAPVFAGLRSTRQVSALAGLGAGGNRLARAGNFGLRHTGGLAATASTNVLASPAGGIAASLLTGQGFPAMDGSTFLAAALGAAGRYGTVSPTNPAVLSAAVHPGRVLTQVHVDALTGHAASQALDAARRHASATPATVGVPAGRAAADLGTTAHLRTAGPTATHDGTATLATAPRASAAGSAPTAVDLDPAPATAPDLAAPNATPTDVAVPASGAVPQHHLGHAAGSPSTDGPSTSSGPVQPADGPRPAAPAGPVERVSAETSADGPRPSTPTPVQHVSAEMPIDGPRPATPTGPAERVSAETPADGPRPSTPTPIEHVSAETSADQPVPAAVPGSPEQQTSVAAGLMPDPGAPAAAAPMMGGAALGPGSGVPTAQLRVEPTAHGIAAAETVHVGHQEVPDDGPGPGEGRRPTPGRAFDEAAASTSEPASRPGGVSAETPAAPPPRDLPSSEQELFDRSPRAIQRYVVEAVAAAQPWADLVLEQLGRVFDALQLEGFPRPVAVGVENAVKTVRSAARKIQPPVQGGSTVGAAFWQMDDLVRFSVQTDPSRYGDSVLATLRYLAQLGWAAPVPRPDQPVHDDWRNTWAPGNRHFGLLTVLTHVETGQRIELQFPTAKSWAVGKQTHQFYETFRLDRDNPLERVVALARILDVVRAGHHDGKPVLGLDKLGASRSNGPARTFAKDPILAAEFIKAAIHKAGSVEAALLRVGVSPETVREIVEAARSALHDVDADGGMARDESESPGLGDLGESSAGGQGARREGSRTEPDAGPSSSPAIPAPPGGPGSGPSGPPGPARSRGPRTGEAIRVQDRDLDQAVGHADPRSPERPRRVGDGAVRRSQREVDLGSGQRQRDDGPGDLRRGPLRPAPAGHPGGSRSGSPQEGHDAPDPRTPPGDLPEPGGPGAGDVGDPVGPGAPRPAELRVGADAATALEHVVADAPVLWLGRDGELPGRVLLLADGSTIRVNTGANPWARSEPDRPLQMWTVGAIHLDDGPLTPAASDFLVDLAHALQHADVGHAGPSSEWLSQRATLDPRTHRITEPGVARGRDVRVWDAAQGWVAAPRAGGLARVRDEGLVTAGEYAGWTAEPRAGQVLEDAARLGAQLQCTRDAESSPEQLLALRHAAAEWAATTVTPALSLFLDQRAEHLGGSEDRFLVELDGGRLAVVTVAVAENDALEGSRPGLVQAGTTADIGRLRNELAERAATPQQRAVVDALTDDLRRGAVRHFRVQGVLTDDEFVGTRVTEFEVLRPVPDRPDVQRTAVEPHRHIDPGLATREQLQRAVAGWTPTSVTDAVDNAWRWLLRINPHHGSFPITGRMPWSNNCGDCSRAVVDVLQGRGARVAFGDTGARVLDDWTVWSTEPGELNEMWRWAGTRPGWHAWQHGAATFSPRFTDHANTRIGQVLAAHPEGTVAIVLVNWADEVGETTGGHWFTAAVTDHGVEWIDGQTAEHHAWPPAYPEPYSGVCVITRAPGSDTWRDLFTGGSSHTGPQVATGAPHAPRPVDPAFATRLANATGDWPDDEDGILRATTGAGR